MSEHASSPEATANPDLWFPELCRAAGVEQEAPPGELYKAMNDLAERAAPISRSWWNWLVLIQALAVAVPMTWFFRRILDWAPFVPALATLASVLALIGALWWWRWRGRQRTWARARLVAEVARCQLAAEACPGPVAPPFLKLIPALEPLLTRSADPAAVKGAWPQWREAWLEARLENQITYYRTAMAKAVGQRQRLSRWMTLLMDFMLALAVAGAVVTLSRRAPEWLRLLGDVRLESSLGFIGAMLPLGIILLQSLRSLQELNRRASRFARQLAMLERERESLRSAATPEAALESARAIESQLLSEVVDWHFDAETAEDYFRIREARAAQVLAARGVQPGHAGARAAWLGIGGIGLLFLGRVMLGRAPWVVGASAFTLCWLAYASPSDPTARSRLKIEGTLLDDLGQPWQPTADRERFGCVIIAHGLADGVLLPEPDGRANWTIRISKALEDRLGLSAPNIGLADWAPAAHPATLNNLDPGNETAKFLADLSGIRPEAHEVGDALAFRLSQLILDGKIDATKPLEFIGHSAGGFVVGRAVVRLRRMNLIPATTHVTLLDTPGQDAELVEELPKLCVVDYYVTSNFVHGLNDDSPPANIHLKHIPGPAGMSLLQAHSYAHEWFLKTITDVGSHEGFERTPFFDAGATAH